MLRWLWTHLSSRRRAQLLWFKTTFTLQNKLKILIGFYMLVAPIPSVYEVELPRNVQQLLANMAIAVTFGFDVAVSERNAVAPVQ